MTWAELEAFFTGAASGMYSGLVSKERGFHESPWIEPSISTFAQALARLPFRMFRESGDNKERVMTHWLIDLMARPNPDAKISEYVLKLITFSLYDFDGEVFWHLGYKSKMSKHPDFITPFSKREARPVLDPTTQEEFIGWEFTINGVPYFADRDDVIHFPRFDPVNYRPAYNPFKQLVLEPRRGRSPLESKRLSITADLAAAHYQKQWFERGVAPGFVFTSPSAPEPGTAENDKFLDKLRANFAGKNGEPLLLGGDDWKVINMAASQKDAEFSRGREISREEQLAGRSVPVLMGKDDASYANANVQLYVMYEFILAPVSEFFCTQLDTCLLADTPDIYCNLSTDAVEVLQEAKRNRIKAATDMATKRVPWDVAARTTGLEMEQFEGSNVAFGDYTEIPVSDILEGSSKAEIATVPPADAPKPPDVVAPKDDPKDVNDPSAPRFIRVLAPQAIRVVTEPPDVLEHVQRFAFASRMAGPFDYQSTQVNLTGDVANQLLAMGAAIPDDVLAEKGCETDPHVTVKYGLDPSVTIDEVREALANSDSALEMAERGGGAMTFGPTAVFELDDYDVVYVSIDSPDLEILNDVFTNGNLPVTNTKSSYVPHATLAYVQKGRGAEFAGNDAFAGTQFNFTEIQFSDTDGKLTPINLAAAVATRRAPRASSRVILIRDSADAVPYTIPEDDLQAIFQIVTDDDAELQKIAEKFHIVAIKLGAQQIRDLIPAAPEVGVDSLVAIDSPYVRDFLGTRANLITSVNQTTGDQILKAIKTGMNNGDSPETIAKGIRDVFNVRKNQADFIARQENGSALNGGRFLQVEDMGYEAGEWLSCRDDNVRASHAPGTGVDGEIVKLGETFSNGCRYPQDPQGARDEVLGCRCVYMPARLSGERMIVGQARRDAYHRAAVIVGLRNADRRFASRLGRYFNDQRGRVLAKVAQRLGA